MSSLHVMPLQHFSQDPPFSRQSARSAAVADLDSASVAAVVVVALVVAAIDS